MSITVIQMQSENNSHLENNSRLENNLHLENNTLLVYFKLSI